MWLNIIMLWSCALDLNVRDLGLGFDFNFKMWEFWPSVRQKYMLVCASVTQNQ